MKNAKDKITNVVAVLSTIGAVITVVQGVWANYVATNPDAGMNWGALALMIGMAIIGWFTGKGANGKTAQ